MTISVITIAKPEKIAPTTKNGGKIVECHPGSIEDAKSVGIKSVATHPIAKIYFEKDIEEEIVYYKDNPKEIIKSIKYIIENNMKQKVVIPERINLRDICG